MTRRIFFRGRAPGPARLRSPPKIFNRCGRERTITLHLPYRPAKPQLFRLDLAEPSARLVSHQNKPQGMDDRRKRQTSTATPAEPADLPWGLESTCVD